MKQMHYDEMSKLWDATFPNNKIIFSMHTWDDEDDDLVTPEVDFTSKELLVKGEYKLIIPSWSYPNDVKEVVGVDLDWTKLVEALSDFNDGHHIFLEELIIGKDGVVRMFLGS